jgi:hypothetical protein
MVTLLLLEIRRIFFIHLLLYLTTLPVSRYRRRRVTRFGDNQLEAVWTEEFVAYFEFLTRQLLQGLKKSGKHISRISRALILPNMSKSLLLEPFSSVKKAYCSICVIKNIPLCLHNILMPLPSNTTTFFCVSILL